MTKSLIDRQILTVRTPAFRLPLLSVNKALFANSPSDPRI